MRMRLGLVLLMLVGLMITACTVQQADDLHFGIVVDDPRNRITVLSEMDVVYFDVYSEQGIGQATVQWLAGVYPQRIVLRLHLRGLEELRLIYGTRVITLGISSMGDNTIWQSAADRRNSANQTDHLAATSPYWMKTTLNDKRIAVPAIPLKDGWIEVELPPDFVQTGHTLFSIHWVDFFRQ